MWHENNFLHDFWMCFEDSIIRHLNFLSKNYGVYTTQMNNCCPFLNGYDVYIFAYDKNIVVVCLDCCGQGEEQTYNESSCMGPIIYENGQEPRESVVFKLKECILLMNERLKVNHSDAKVFGVLLTEATITNADSLSPLWNESGLMVIDGINRLQHRTIHVNRNTDLPVKALVDIALNDQLTINNSDSLDSKSTNDVPKKEEEEEHIADDYFEDYEKILQDLLDDEFSNEEEDETNQEDDDEDETDSLANTPIPSGIIQQNDRTNVELEILRPFANPREELDKLIGCDNIKQNIDQLVALATYNKMMHELFPDSKQHEISLHSIFLGRPGTGKTTVAKIYGSLLRQAGVLSKGHVVVCDRNTFIGQYWGDEERVVHQVLEIAQGGVLMIDEAYLFNSQLKNDPAKLVLQQLLSILADEKQRDIAVLLCGYKEPMLQMIATNPGFESRFPNQFEFRDFTIDELMEITKRRIEEYKYEFTAEAWKKYRLTLEQAYQTREPETWGNARFVANLLERIYVQHATRCIKQQITDKSLLRTLTPDDIVPLCEPRKNNQRRIGFK